jgi:hypothetical protein
VTKTVVSILRDTIATFKNEPGNAHELNSEEKEKAIVLMNELLSEVHGSVLTAETESERMVDAGSSKIKLAKKKQVILITQSYIVTPAMHTC